MSYDATTAGPKVNIRVNLHDKQRAIYRDDTAEVVIARCGRKFGKSRGSRYRVAQGYKRNLSATANVFQTLEWLPTIDDFGQFLLNAELGVESMMNDRLSLRLVAKNSHNSEPPAGKEDNDLSLIAGIGYKL